MHSSTSILVSERPGSVRSTTSDGRNGALRARRSDKKQARVTRTDRVAPPRVTVAAPVATRDDSLVSRPPAEPARTLFSPAGPEPAAGTGAPAPAAHPAHLGDPGSPGSPGDPGGPGGPVGTEPPARWRLTDLEPADLAELADLVMERIEGRVRGELERRGRRGVPGVF